MWRQIYDGQLSSFGIEKLTIMANEIYDTGKRNQVQSNVNFIAQ